MIEYLSWHKKGWDDYLYWMEHSQRHVKRIHDLLKAIMREPFDGIGEPEALKYDLAGCYSRRIDSANRIVYKIVEKSCLHCSLPWSLRMSLKR